MRKHAILLIDLNMFFGGGQVYLSQLSEVLRDRAALYAFCVNPKVAQQLRDRGVHAVSFARALNMGKPVHMCLCVMMCVWFRLFRGVDTIWVNGIPDIVAMPVARVLGCTALATRHLTLEIEEQEWYRGRKRRAAEFLYRKLASSAHKIVCVSQAVADDLTRIVSAKKLVVIQNWVSSLPELSQLSRQQQRPFRLLYVGRLQKYKGASTVLAAMRRLESANPERGIALTIVGEGRYREELQLEAEGLDVQFAGFQQDPTPYYRNADVFLNPSMGPEGLPLVSLEAMSHGLPCIFSDLPVHKEITDHGMSSLLFKAGDVDDLCLKISLLLCSQELLEHYGQSARKRIESTHTIASARVRYLQLLEQHA